MNEDEVVVEIVTNGPIILKECPIEVVCFLRALKLEEAEGAPEFVFHDDSGEARIARIEDYRIDFMGGGGFFWGRLDTAELPPGRHRLESAWKFNGKEIRGESEFIAISAESMRGLFAEASRLAAKSKKVHGASDIEEAAVFAISQSNLGRFPVSQVQFSTAPKIEIDPKGLKYPADSRTLYHVVRFASELAFAALFGGGGFELSFMDNQGRLEMRARFMRAGGGIERHHLFLFREMMRPLGNRVHGLRCDIVNDKEFILTAVFPFQEDEELGNPDQSFDFPISGPGGEGIELSEEYDGVLVQEPALAYAEA